MKLGRREFVAASVGAAAYALSAPFVVVHGGPKMYGIIGKAVTKSGKREEFISILLEGVSGMPGCLSYIVARDAKDPEGVWITEVWDSRESHAASLQLPEVKAAIAKGKPLIESFASYFETEPVGGHGLPRK